MTRPAARSRIIGLTVRLSGVNRLSDCQFLAVRAGCGFLFCIQVGVGLASSREGLLITVAQMKSNVTILSAAAACLLACAQPAAATSAHSWSQASSIGRDALVVVALGLPLSTGDWTGDKQAAFSMGGAFVTTELLKQLVHEQRPDRSNGQSFPSGHTSVSFAAAASLEKRYGWKIGVPAHVVAAFVGVARIKARKHFVQDVVAGAVIGEASGWLFTSRKDTNLRWLPWGDAHGGGAAVAVRF